jgi:hypothetical protein
VKGKKTKTRDSVNLPQRVSVEIFSKGCWLLLLGADDFRRHGIVTLFAVIASVRHLVIVIRVTESSKVAHGAAASGVADCSNRARGVVSVTSQAYSLNVQF